MVPLITTAKKLMLLFRIKKKISGEIDAFLMLLEQDFFKAGRHFKTYYSNRNGKLGSLLKWVCRTSPIRALGLLRSIFTIIFICCILRKFL